MRQEGEEEHEEEEEGEEEEEEEEGGEGRRLSSLLSYVIFASATYKICFFFKFKIFNTSHL